MLNGSVNKPGLQLARIEAEGGELPVYHTKLVGVRFGIHLMKQANLARQITIRMRINISSL